MEGVLVAGGSGLIGRALTTRLSQVDRGLRVRAVGGSQDIDFLTNNTEYQKRDLVRDSNLSDLLTGIDTVVFCAGGAGGMGQFKNNAARMAMDACSMNVNLLRTCSEVGVKRIIMIASATMYPESDGAIVESDLDLNRDPAPAYKGLGQTWRYLEKLAKWLGEEFSFEVVVLRTANIFGPYCRFDLQRSNFIPALIRKAVDKMDPFEVYGSPDATRDVLFVDDLIEAIVKLLEKESIGIQSFNMGSGYPTRVSEVAEWSLKYSEHKPVSGINYTNSNYKVPANRWLDCSKLRNFIDWKPPENAEVGIAKLVAWWQENRTHWNR